jgi:hypothetical protein
MEAARKRIRRSIAGLAGSFRRCVDRAHQTRETGFSGRFIIRAGANARGDLTSFRRDPRRVRKPFLSVKISGLGW